MSMLAATKNAIEKAGFKVYGSYVMIDGTLFPLPLVQGNDKLGRRVWHSSIVPTNETMTAYDAAGNEISESGTCPCHCAGCYADNRGRYKMNSVKYALIMRTKLLREYPAIYFLLVRIQLTHERIERVRIHAAGDFIESEARGWYDVLKDFPAILAWTYTKHEWNQDLELLDSLPNMNIVKSIIKGCGFNFGHVAYIAQLFYRLKRAGKKVYICRCGIDPNQHCSDCDGCATYEYVLFIEHSTKYNAKKDYGFKKLAALIENQKNM